MGTDNVARCHGEGRKFQAATDLTNIQQNILDGLHALHAFSKRDKSICQQFTFQNLPNDHTGMSVALEFFLFVSSGNFSFQSKTQCCKFNDTELKKQQMTGLENKES